MSVRGEAECLLAITEVKKVSFLKRSPLRINKCKFTGCLQV